MARSANQVELARIAGVSVSTVSRALSNSRGISAELRTQILQLADQMGYRSRGSSEPESRTIRMYVTTNAATGGLATFYNVLIDAMQTAAREAELTLEIRLSHDKALDLARLERDAGPDPVAVTLVMGIDPPDEVLSQFGPSRPLILVNAFDPLMRFDCVAPNNYYGAYWATRRLLEAGHRSLLHVRDQHRWTTTQRERGFLAAVDDTEGAKGRVVDIRLGDDELHTAIAERQAGTADWTGIFCVHDMAAVRVVHALEAAHFRIPQDVSVVGFDDLPAASLMTPKLSTMQVDCVAMGQEAIALVLRRLGQPNARPIQVESAVTSTEGGTIAKISAT
ncbi:MAG: LacI family DNA-binding transcriptional regulator [Devosia sp.]|nr:LacI family DNA-binding transcriptional regulator [Devosia sp.]